MESIKCEIAALRTQTSMAMVRSQSQPLIKDSELPALSNPSRVKKLTKFFGTEPPLIRLFLRELGYEVSGAINSYAALACTRFCKSAPMVFVCKICSNCTSVRMCAYACVKASFQMSPRRLFNFFRSRSVFPSNPLIKGFSMTSVILSPSLFLGLRINHLSCVIL